MKRYAQRCPAARALDVLGERWTPLVVRELMSGPKRFTDLANGLPGIGTNILTKRLADLQDHGVVDKRTLPPPTPVTVYELTDAGRALAPLLRELRIWGARYGPPPQPGDAVRSSWVLQSAASRNASLRPGASCELRVGEEVFSITAGEDGVEVTTGPSAAPDVAMTIEPRLVLRLAADRIEPAAAIEQIGIEGDRRVAADVLAMIAGSAT
jgi:DNA-binding HxlR family transcriptional regulator